MIETTTTPAKWPMPWVLIATVVLSTTAALVADTGMERLLALVAAEAVIVGYICIALLMPRLTRARMAKRARGGEST